MKNQTLLRLLLPTVLLLLVAYGARQAEARLRWKSWSSALPSSLIDRLTNECLEIQRFEEANDMNTVYKDNKKPTRWYPLGDRPRIAVEEAIQRLYALIHDHAKDSGIIGAEWWVQVVQAEQGKLGFHLDKDEAIASLEHRLVHPSFGSILYLTDVGGATLIFDQYSPTGNGYEPKVAKHAAASLPLKGKYTLFGGNLLHGVLPGPDRKKARGRKRITFLVNFWTHRPAPPNLQLFDPVAYHMSVMSKAELRKFRKELDAEQNEPKVMKLLKHNMHPDNPDRVPSYTHRIELPGGDHNDVVLPRKMKWGSTVKLSWTRPKLSKKKKNETKDEEEEEAEEEKHEPQRYVVKRKKKKSKKSKKSKKKKNKKSKRKNKKNKSEL